MKHYAGIGARGTPQKVLLLMTQIAAILERKGWTLRSGGATGADSAFAAGVSEATNAEIYLPWSGFNDSASPMFGVCPEALCMAEVFHPAWNACSDTAKKFHARNCYQVLGKDLCEPSKFIVCWTPNGQAAGGTGQALRIAEHYAIPIFNLAIPESLLRLDTFVKNNTSKGEQHESVQRNS